MLSTHVDLVWAVIVGSILFFTLATTLVGLIYLSQRRHLQYQQLMVKELTAEVEQRRTAEARLAKSERRYRTLVEEIDEMYCVLDSNLFITYASPNMVSATSDDGGIAGRQFVSLVDPRDRARVRTFFANRAKKRDPAQTCEFRLQLNKGTEAWTELGTRLEMDDSGKVKEYRSLLRDITERKHGEAMLRTLTRRVIDAQEAERRRVARDLHDGVIQLLSSVRFRLQSIKRGRHSQVTKPDLLVESDRIVQRGIDEIRRISHNLRPSVLDDFGLVPAIRNVCDEFETKTHVKVALQIPDNFHRLADDVELALYRVIQESLNNIEKHAQASRVSVSLVERTQFAEAVIQDNGRGLRSPARVRVPSSQHGGMGMNGMKERILLNGGSIRFNSVKGRGLKIVVRIPMSQRALEA